MFAPWFFVCVIMTVVLTGCQTASPEAPVAVSGNGCPTTQHVPLEEFKANRPPGIVGRLTDEKKTVFMAAYNRTPPTSDLTVDAVHLYRPFGAPFVEVWFLDGDCVREWGLAGIKEVDAWLEGRIPTEPGAPRQGA